MQNESFRSIFSVESVEVFRKLFDMKLWKKIVLILFAVLLLAQIPFIYRRYENGELAVKIANLDAQKQSSVDEKFNDFKGVVHVHTSLGGHSTGDFDELIEAASRNNLDFVLMTEHTSELYDTAALTLRGNYKNVLFVAGNEANTKSDERFLVLSGFPNAAQSRKFDTTEFLAQARAENKLALVIYPEKFNSWNADFDGVEVFSLFTNAKKISIPFFLLDALWSFRAYPELTIARHLTRPDENLKRYDEITRDRKSTVFAGSDAHSNVGAHLFGDDAGGKLINLKFDSYKTIFRLVRTHVLIEKDKPLTEENLLAALKNGRAYIGFDVLSDAGGFSFTAENGGESKSMGDEIALSSGVKLKLSAAQPARFVVFRNGEKAFEANEGNRAEFQINQPGTYRAEVYLDQLGAPFDRLPWIISNPIYVK